MVRWEPNARERLAKAALELYEERGFDNTAVADIAERAGLTERTFFRHFADKREVLFSGTAELTDTLTQSVASAADDSSVLAIVLGAFEAASPFFESRRPFASLRQKIIMATPALHERELIKLAGMASSLAEALLARGVASAAAVLAAETGVTIFRVAWAQWLVDPERREMTHHLRRAREELKTLTAA